MSNLYRENLRLNDQFDSIVYNELESQYYYILGLLLLRQENNGSELDKTITGLDGNEISSQNVTSFFCLTKSILLSKPNSSFLAQDQIGSKHNPIEQVLLNDFLKLLHRDSCWKYSIIGNWLRFVITKNYSNDASTLLVLIKNFQLKADVNLNSLS